MTASPCTRWPFAVIKCASRRIAPLFSDGAERSILPSPWPANWSVYNAFNYPVRSFAGRKLTPGTRRVTDDSPCTRFHGKADRTRHLAREPHKVGRQDLSRVAGLRKDLHPLLDSIPNWVATFPLKSPSTHPDSSAACPLLTSHTGQLLLLCNASAPPADILQKTAVMLTHTLTAKVQAAMENMENGVWGVRVGRPFLIWNLEPSVRLQRHVRQMFGPLRCACTS